MDTPRIALDPDRLLGFDQADREKPLPAAKVGPKEFAHALRSKVGDKGPRGTVSSTLQAKVGDKGPRES